MPQNKKINIISEERRQILKGAGAIAATAVAASSFGSAALAGEHQHHHMAASSATANLAKVLHACVAESENCINHCLDLFKTGDTTLADCAISVQETMAFCAAHAKLASYDSKFLKEMTELSIKVCTDCETQCRKHEKKHALCKACADSCAQCIKACKAYIG